MSNQRQDIRQVKNDCNSNCSYIMNVPNNRVYENCCPTNSRTSATVIKSGQQPHNKVYSYSYNDYMKNKRKITYETKLPTSKPSSANNVTSGYGGNCPDNKPGCSPSDTIWGVNNTNYHKQGSVSSSSRLERLKLETIRGSSRCASDPSICNGKYVGDKIRFTEFVQNRPCFPLYRRNRIREKKNNC